jgi:hypothetical protein
MTPYGCLLSSEELAPVTLIQQAGQAGFDAPRQ